MTDRQTEYDNYLRCPKCNRKTDGIDDFKNIRNGHLTKTCIKCRKCILKCHKKNNILRKKLTKQGKIDALVLLLSNIPDEIINKEKDKELLKIYNDIRTVKITTINKQ